MKTLINLTLIFSYSETMAMMKPVIREKFPDKNCFSSLLDNLFDIEKPLIVFDDFQTNIYYPDFAREIYDVRQNFTNIFKQSQLIVVGYLDEEHLYDLLKKTDWFERVSLLIITLGSTQNITDIFTSTVHVVWNNKGTILALAQWNIYDKKMSIVTNFDLNRKKVHCSSMSFRYYPDICSSGSFSQKTFPTSQKCELRVFQIPDETFAVHKKRYNVGVVSKLVEQFAEMTKIQFNTDLIENVSYHEDFFLNASSDRVIALLEKGIYDVITGPLFLRAHGDFEYGPIVYKDRYVGITKKELEIHSTFSAGFSDDFWNIWMIAFFGAVVCYYLSCILLGEKKISFVESLFDFQKVSFGGPMKNLPMTYSGRVLWTLYCFGSLIVCSLYLATMSSVLTSASFAVMNTRRLDLLFERGFTVLFSNYMEYVLRIEDSLTSRYGLTSGELARRTIRTNTTEWDVLQHVLSFNRSLFAITLSSLMEAHPSEAGILDKFTPSVQPYLWLMTFYVSKKSALKDPLLYWTNEMFEKGFTQKWISDIIEENRNHVNNPYEKEMLTGSSLDNLKIIFQIFATSQALIFVIFILEIVFYKMDLKFRLYQNLYRLAFEIFPALKK